MMAESKPPVEGAGGAATGGFSFSLGAAGKRKPSGKPGASVILIDDDEDKGAKRDFIVAIEGSDIKSAEPTKPRGPLVIPLLQNPSPAPYIRKKSAMVVALAQGGEAQIGEKFDAAPMEVDDEQKKDVKYGLNLPGGKKAEEAAAAASSASPAPARQEQAQPPNSAQIDSAATPMNVVETPAVKHEDGNGAVKKESEEGPLTPPPTPVNPEDVPLLLRNRIPGLENITDETEKFKKDVEARPDEAPFEAYDSVPVEDYGEAMLRGMGWEPGQPIGLTNKGLCVPIEFVKRHHRLGLGAVPKAPEVKQKRFIKPGESREPKPLMVVAKDADGRQRHYRTLDEKLVPFKPNVLGVGATVGIVSGVHDGMSGRVISMDSTKASVRLRNGETVEVQISEISLMHEGSLAEDHPALASQDEESAAPARPSSSSSSSSSSTTTPSSAPGSSDQKRRTTETPVMSPVEKRATKGTSSAPTVPSWVRPNLIVRVVSKSWEGGKYYQKKGRIVDVTRGDECSLRLLDNNLLLEGVRERQLQTVIPKVGEHVLVVAGPMRGKTARLLETKDGKDAVVQMDEELDVHSFPYDDVCAIAGEHIRLQPISVDDDYVELYQASHGENEPIWRYLPWGPFKSAQEFRDHYLAPGAASTVLVAYVVFDKVHQKKIGIITCMNIAPEHRRLELGGIWYTPSYHRSYANTESVFLLLCYSFETLKYRRVEWKCNNENVASRNAALGLGFQFEGVFRKHMIIKGENRDTAWFSITDAEWPEVKAKLMARMEKHRKQ